MIVYCLGLHSSGSTWLYNVVRDIMAAAGLEPAAFRAEGFGQLIDSRASTRRHAVLRGHNMNGFMLRMLNLAGAKAVLSFRDPRDAVGSFLQRFGSTGAQYVPVCVQTARNLASLLSASQQLEHLAFFYEDGYTARPETVFALAAFIGVEVSEAALLEIFRKYRAESVKALVDSLAARPEDQKFITPRGTSKDLHSSFHSTHISDMRVNKWRDVLTEPQKLRIGELLDEYAWLLGERTIGTGRTPQRGDGVRPLQRFGITFSSSLFAPVDSLDHFTRFLTSAEAYNLRHIQVLRGMYLPEGEWDLRLRVPGIGALAATLFQNSKAVRSKSTQDGTASFRLINRLHDFPFDVKITYDRMAADVAAGLPPPAAVLEASLHRALDEI